MNDFPEDAKKTLFGKALMRMTEELNDENFKDEINAKKQQNLKNMAMDIGGLELARKTIALQEEGHQDARKAMAGVKDKASSGFTPPTHAPGR